MALAYGDQLSNMLQPFWTLALLGITKLKARDIFPYRGIIMFAGIVICTFSLLLFLNKKTPPLAANKTH